MSFGNSNKLQQIKMKYGYTHSNQTANQPKPDPFANKNQQSGILNHIEEKINASRMHLPKYSTQKQSQNQQKNTKESVSSIFSMNTLQIYPQSKHNYSLSECEHFLQGADSLGVLRQSTKHSNKPTNDGQNFVESYQKTYDLLKNYRRKIKSTFQAQAKDKTLQINPNKSLMKDIDKQNITPPLPQKKAQWTLKQINKAKEQKQNERSQSIARMGVKIRKNLLQGIDLNKIDLRTQLSHIEQLQSKIQSVLGVTHR